MSVAEGDAGAPAPAGLAVLVVGAHGLIGGVKARRLPVLSVRAFL